MRPTDSPAMVAEPVSEITISGPSPNANCMPAPVNDCESENRVMLRRMSGGTRNAGGWFSTKTTSGKGPAVLTSAFANRKAGGSHGEALHRRDLGEEPGVLAGG